MEVLRFFLILFFLISRVFGQFLPPFSQNYQPFNPYNQQQMNYNQQPTQQLNPQFYQQQFNKQPYPHQPSQMYQSHQLCSPHNGFPFGYTYPCPQPDNRLNRDQYSIQQTSNPSRSVGEPSSTQSTITTQASISRDPKTGRELLPGEISASSKLYAYVFTKQHLKLSDFYRMRRIQETVLQKDIFWKFGRRDNIE